MLLEHDQSIYWNKYHKFYEIVRDFFEHTLV